MQKRFVIIMFICLITLFVLLFAEEPKSENTFCWKITSETGTVYLMGSLHLCKPEIYPLDQAIINAYEDSEILVVEADTSSEGVNASIQENIIKKGLYSDGTSLKDHLSDESFKKFEDFCTARGIDPAQMSKMRPWLLSLQISGLEAMKLGSSPETGLDKHFLGRAKKEKKPVKELESATFQIDMFSSFSSELQELLLIQTLEKIDEIKTTIERMEKAWVTGDLEAMDAVLTEQPQDPRLKTYHTKMYDERNVSMAAKIEDYLKSGITHFVIAGSNHISGKKGILNLLKAKNKNAIRIEQITAMGKPEE